MTDKPTPPAENPFRNEKFKDFMRKLVAVPKSAIVAEEKKWKKKRAKLAKKKKGTDS
jgi:hypothetical protein